MKHLRKASDCHREGRGRRPDSLLHGRRTPMREETVCPRREHRASGRPCRAIDTDDPEPDLPKKGPSVEQSGTLRYAASRQDGHQVEEVGTAVVGASRAGAPPVRPRRAAKSFTTSSAETPHSSIHPSYGLGCPRVPGRAGGQMGHHRGAHGRRGSRSCLS